MLFPSLSPTTPTIPSIEPTSPLSGSSVYFTTSEPKAKFLTRYSQDMSKCHIAKNTKDLSQKKVSLILYNDGIFFVMSSTKSIPPCNSLNPVSEDLKTEELVSAVRLCLES